MYNLYLKKKHFISNTNFIQLKPIWKIIVIFLQILKEQ
jgi:hypothetical protein